jgi:hypothetical protein
MDELKRKIGWTGETGQRVVPDGAVAPVLRSAGVARDEALDLPEETSVAPGSVLRAAARGSAGSEAEVGRRRPAVTISDAEREAAYQRIRVLLGIEEPGGSHLPTGAVSPGGSVVRAAPPVAEPAGEVDESRHRVYGTG